MNITTEQDTQLHKQVMKILCLAGTFAAMTFAVYHFFWQDRVVALILVPVMGIQLYAYLSLLKYGYTLSNAYMVVVMQTGAVISFVYFVGVPASYWIFASAVANYFIVSARPALFVNCVVILVIALLLVDDPEYLFRLLSSFALMNYFLYSFSIQLTKKTQQINELLVRDSLTGAGNRLALDEALAQAHASFKRYGQVVSLLMIDLDYFKKVNDDFGHTEGDRLLKSLAKVITERLRLSDRFFRFGGEEFVIVAENTNVENARILAEDIRAKVAAKKFPPAGGITISIGVAELMQEESTDGWLKRADDALYDAKAQGRDRVSCNIPAQQRISGT